MLSVFKVCGPNRNRWVWGKPVCLLWVLLRTGFIRWV